MCKYSQKVGFEYEMKKLLLFVCFYFDSINW